MIKSKVLYYDKETELEGFVAGQAGQKGPLVILCHSWAGRDAFICELAEMIANWGYVGFASDLYVKGGVR